MSQTLRQFCIANCCPQSLSRRHRRLGSLGCCTQHTRHNRKYWPSQSTAVLTASVHSPMAAPKRNRRGTVQAAALSPGLRRSVWSVGQIRRHCCGPLTVEAEAGSLSKSRLGLQKRTQPATTTLDTGPPPGRPDSSRRHWAPPRCRGHFRGIHNLPRSNRIVGPMVWHLCPADYWLRWPGGVLPVRKLLPVPGVAQELAEVGVQQLDGLRPV
mmetsp:Transcript_114901/g.228694  ORF Transcript_114901/g.228694 Transcript_114901/m.228694 type:complete len:212 (+) Transcript_114901:599-1234(+)